MSKTGNLSIHSENIFPIIKKWLYSDHDIFVRELISNASDAILKFKKLCDMGQTEDKLGEEFKITVTVDKDSSTITISDNGIGLTEEEIEKYINQIAFSGAEDFLNKYKDKMDDDQIIGHFGLGFYSAFMVSKQVQINTLSYEGGQPLLWTCDGGTTFELTEGSRTTRGTDIILHIADESREFLGFYKLSQIVEKYCSFMPIPIYMIDANKKVEDTDDSEEETTEKAEEKPINDIHPLYTLPASECTDEQYKAFYRKTFSDYNEPLFWIHLNMDYPFKLKGILYFPKLQNNFEIIEGKIKLYNNQVFVADNIKEVIPEFLLLLKGVLDCPDLPLNVSRSFLQNDGFVKKISDYITKKVADKLISLYKKEPEQYKKFWDDISPFIKYGCLRDQKFSDKINDYILFKTLDDDHVTMSEYLGHDLPNPKDNNHAEVATEDQDKIFYVSDKEKQSQYISLFKENGLKAVYLPHPIDASFISHLEARNPSLKFMRIDSDVSGALGEAAADKSNENEISGLFKVALNKDDIKVSIENLNSDTTPSMIVISEEGRRMQDMMKMYGMPTDNLPASEMTLILNQNHELIKKLIDKDVDATTKDLICKHLYDLALISNQSLDPEAMKEFLVRNCDLLLNLTNTK
ncbi:MAG: molecular chaperone HtpG [Candidatus Epulonipiscioides saccharophilum]|nr:MAG: molecular chaperone HtpG [Epulopiscium sp. AS2M-Bin001]